MNDLMNQITSRPTHNGFRHQHQKIVTNFIVTKIPDSVAKIRTLIPKSIQISTIGLNRCEARTRVF